MGMYLKEIEISNFKSFKGEVTIPLDRGFTAITGPNGSGKSNCGDAIQFVLGPRSNKTIRAQNSKDLIFNGGKNSKPARSCEVTLIFANPVLSSKRRRLPIDSDEVRMTRKIRLTKSNNVVNEYEDVYLENLESKEYFEYLLKYYKSWKKSSPSEFNYLFGKDRDIEELAYCQMDKEDRYQISN